MVSMPVYALLTIFSVLCFGGGSVGVQTSTRLDALGKHKVYTKFGTGKSVHWALTSLPRAPEA